MIRTANGLADERGKFDVTATRSFLQEYIAEHHLQEPRIDEGLPVADLEALRSKQITISKTSLYRADEGGQLTTSNNFKPYRLSSMHPFRAIIIIISRKAKPTSGNVQFLERFGHP